ncbi:hypothetical protein QR680_004881 [Steinernema hermaphroditum]|uniref:Uncharacterized protein n=1 Tax=Steinernema hermaphroditum TaxID=289476 RepID=A0AA39HQ56_9BILA|nr:hypothetical protein QR680_004881 [Steinernema hermaphroditum]
MSVGQLFVGVVYTSISSVSLCLYVIVLYIFKSPSSPFKSSAYRIMIHLGIADCLQNVFHLSNRSGSFVGLYLAILHRLHVPFLLPHLRPEALRLGLRPQFVERYRILDRPLQYDRILTSCDIVYLVIFVRLYMFRKKQNQPPTELRILVQAIIISVYTSPCLVGRHIYKYFLPNTKWTLSTRLTSSTRRSTRSST